MSNPTYEARRQADNREHRAIAATMTAEGAAIELNVVANDTREQGGPCAEGDADSLEALAEMLNECVAVERVLASAQYLETGARDLIPGAVWLFLGGTLVYGFGDE